MHEIYVYGFCNPSICYIMKRIFFLSFITGLSIFTATAQNPYFLDTSFGISGVHVVPNPLFGSSPYKMDKVWNMAIAPDNKIVLGGNLGATYAPQGIGGDWAITRLKANGQLDSSFNSTGHLKFSGSNQPDAKELNNLVVLPDHKILYAGKSSVSSNSKIIVFKINEDGSFDSSFGQNGVTHFSAGPGSFNSLSAMSAQSDNKVLLLASNFDYQTNIGGIVRLNNNGSLDATFGNGGIMSGDLGFASNYISYSMIKVLSDNSFLVTGTHLTNSPQDFIRVNFVAKFNADGTLQTSFGTNGKVILPISASERLSFLNKYIDVDNNGFIYVNCSTNGPVTPEVLVYKISPTGSIVTNYGQNGRLAIPGLHHDSWYYYDACIQDSNKLLVAGMIDTGNNAHYKIKRILEDGTEDLTFAGTSSEITGTRNAFDHFHFLGLQDSNKIILGGYGKKEKSGEDLLFPVVMRFTNAVEDGGTDTTVTSIQHVPGQNPIKIYPNPIHNYFSVEGIYAMTDITIQDITGKTIFTQRLNNKAAQTIDCAQWLPGIYLIRLKEKDGTVYTYKVSKY